MAKGGFVYILTNKRYGVLYTGVTSDLAVRIHQHRERRGGRFTARYKATMLIYFEEYPTIEEAIAREKAIKAWKRMWKIEAIERMNPGWTDLFERINC